MSSRSSIALPSNCGNWLAENGCLIAKQLKKKGSNVLLGPDNIKLLVSGLAFGRAIQAALGKNKLLDGLRINNKEGNWNALVPVLRRLTVRVDNDAKSLILSGDAQVAARLMNQLWATFSIDRSRGQVKSLGKIRDSSNSGYASQAKAAARAAPQRRAALAKKKQEEAAREALKRKEANVSSNVGGQTRVKPLIEQIMDEEIDMLKNNQNMLPSDAESIPAFWCVLLVEQLNVRPEQAVTLVTANTNYLFHIFVNGIKGSFVPILALCRTVFQHVDTIVDLLAKTKTYQRNLRKDQRNRSYRCMCMSMDIMRFGLVSNNPDVALWCCRIITHLVAKLSEVADAAHLQQHCWDWFNGVSASSGKGGSPQDIAASGLNAAVTAIAKNPDLKLGIIAMIDGIANKELGSLFNTALRLVLPTPLKYMSFVCDTLETFLEERETMEEALMSQGVVKFWVDLAKVHCEPNVATDVRCAAFHLVTEIWNQIPKAVEAYPSMPKLLLGLLKKGTRDKSAILNITAITCLFELLDNFAESDSVSFAPYVYKTLIFSLVENHENELVYDYIMSNMSNALEKHPQVPVGVMVEPMTKQATLKGYSNNDFNGFVTLSKHPRLSLRHGLLLGDLLGKIAINDPIYGRVASIPLLIIVNRFHNEPTMQEYMERFSKVALSMLMHIETRDKVAKRTKDDGKKITGQDKKMHISPRQAEEREIGQVRRILILEVLAKIIHLGHLPIVKRIEPLIKTLEAQYKGMNSSKDTLSHPGMAALAKFCEEVKNGGVKQEDEDNDDMMFPDQDPLEKMELEDDGDNLQNPPAPESKSKQNKVFSQKFVPDEKKLNAKRGTYSKPWLEPAATMGDDGDDEAEEDLLDGGSLKVSGLGEVKTKRKKRIGRFKNRTVQDDINRAGERLKQRILRGQHEEQRKRLRSRELRQTVRARFIATENRRKAHAATGGGKNFKAHQVCEEHDYGVNAPKRYMASVAGNQSSLILQHQQEVYEREVEFQNESVLMMNNWKKPLEWLYYMYAHADCGMLVKEETFYEQKMAGLQIGIREWQILCRDFNVTPCMGTVKENSNHYHSANISLKTEGDKMAMEYDEFCCAFRHIAREAPCLQEIPSEAERIIALMSFMRRQACIVDKVERGTLKNRRMGDRRHWSSNVIPMIEWKRTIPAHFGFTPQSVIVMEILDDLVFDIFGVHTLPNVPVPWNKETWSDPPKKWVPKTTEPSKDPVVVRNYLPRKAPPEPKKTQFRGFRSSARRFKYQAETEDKIINPEALDVRVRHFGDSAMKQLPLKWVKMGKICIELLDKLIGDVINGNARGRLKQRYGEMDKYKVELKDYNEGFQNRKAKFIKLPWGKETIQLRAPILPPKESEKVVDKLKRENELKRLKNIKREKNRKKRQKELQEQLAEIAKQKEREKRKNMSKKELLDEKKRLKAEQARAIESERRRNDRKKIKEWRAERDAEKAFTSKKEMLRSQQLAAKNKDAVERINNRYHWEQARKEKARKEQEEAEARQNQDLKKRMDIEKKEKKKEMAAKSNERRAAKREEDEAAAKIQAMYRGKADRQKLEEENSDYKAMRAKQKKKKKKKKKNSGQ